MATTITTADWDATGVLKNGSVQAQTVSKIKEKVFNVSFGMCDAYTACGMTLDLSDGGRFTTVTFVTVGQISNPAYIPAYVASACDVASTGTIQFYESVAGACAVALAEIAACTMCLPSFKVHVIGT